MRRSAVAVRCLLVSTAMGCQPTAVSRSRVAIEHERQAPPPPTYAPGVRQAPPLELTRETARRLNEYGFPVDASRLSVELVEGDEFVDGLAQNASHFELPGQFEALSGIARLFGMPRGREPDELRYLARKAVGEATLAYYDHVTKRLVIRKDAGARLLNLEALVAHELAHAYQDQSLGGLESFINGHSHSLDHLRAAHGVLEGQAEVIGAGVEWAKRGISLARLDPNIADASVGRLTAGESFSIVYEAGRRFILLCYRDGGWQRVADAMRNPPTSTEQLLHPEKFRQDLPTDVVLPDPPRSMNELPMAFDGTIGELLIYNRLLPLTNDLNLARIAAAGWDGDRLRVFTLPDSGLAAAWRILWDRVEDAQQFERVASKSLAGRLYVGLTRHGRTTDLVYSDLSSHYDALVKSMAQKYVEPKVQPADAASTAAVELGWQEAKRLRPFVTANRWILPEHQMSFAIPAGFSAVTLRGVDILAATPEDGFTSNISVVYEQDLFGGDLERYVREFRYQTLLTSQKWILDDTMVIENSKAAIVELEIPSGKHLVTAAMGIFLRNGRWITVTCASLARRAQARQLLADVMNSLRLE